jgi:heme-degrading monooxygenase HmoA
MFRPGTYDDDFQELDAQIDAYARGLDGFEKVEKWYSEDRAVVNAMYFFRDMAAVKALATFPHHIEAKRQVDRWYDGYRVVVSEVTTSYGPGAL